MTQVETLGKPQRDDGRLGISRCASARETEVADGKNAYHLMGLVVKKSLGPAIKLFPRK